MLSLFSRQWIVETQFFGQLICSGLLLLGDSLKTSKHAKQLSHFNLIQLGNSRFDHLDSINEVSLLFLIDLLLYATVSLLLIDILEL